MIARLLQLADSSFPTGAFVHSFGLETAVAEGSLDGPRSLERWLRSYLDDALATLDGPAFVRAFDEPANVDDLDAILAAATWSDEVRAANGAIARAMLDSYLAVGIQSVTLGAYAHAIDEERASGSPALASALGASAAGIALDDALVAFFSTTIGALGGVAARAIPLGGRSVARVLWNLREAIETAAAHARNVGRGGETLTTQAFGCEIDALRHRLLDGRLFAS